MAFKALILAALIAGAVAYAVPEKLKLGYNMPTPWVNPQVVGGADAVRGAAPHIVSLQWGFIFGMSHFCAGSVIGESWILTAGHCIQAVPDYGTLLVKAGLHDLSEKEPSEQSIEVEKMIVHEQYPGGVAPFDIALIKLKTPLKLNNNVQAIGLPAAGSIPVGDVVLNGWGSTSTTSNPVMPDILQEATFPVVDNDACKKAVEDLTGPAPSLETNVCTGPLHGGFSACSGDSGGPLVERKNGKNTLIGVVSWGIIPCGSAGAPSVYTRVSYFNEWIAGQIANN